MGQNGQMNSLTIKVGRYSVVGLLLFSVVFLTCGERIASLWAGRRIDFSLIIVVLVCFRAWTRVLSSLFWHTLVGYKLIRGLLWATILSGTIYAVLYAALIRSYGVLSIVVSQSVAQSAFIITAAWIKRK